MAQNIFEELHQKKQNLISMVENSNGLILTMLKITRQPKI